MKEKICIIVVVLAFASFTNAVDTLVVDNFESYADSAALTGAWVPNASSNITSETLVNALSGKCMLIQNNSNSPYFAQTKLALPGAVWNDHGVNLTYPGYTDIQMTFAIPPSTPGQNLPWGDMGGTGGRVFLSMYDCYGIKVLGATYTSGATPSGTGWSSGITWNIPFATYKVAGQNLENVYQITVGYDSTYNGTGALLVDNVTLIPEPATLTMLALGAIGLLRRQK